MKLTATAVICRRTAASIMSPRHWRETELAMSQRGHGTQISSEQQKQGGQVRSSYAANQLWRKGGGGGTRGGGQHSNGLWVGGAQRTRGEVKRITMASTCRVYTKEVGNQTQKHPYVAFTRCRKCENPNKRPIRVAPVA